MYIRSLSSFHYSDNTTQVLNVTLITPSSHGGFNCRTCGGCRTEIGLPLATLCCVSRITRSWLVIGHSIGYILTVAPKRRVFEIFWRRNVKLNHLWNKLPHKQADSQLRMMVMIYLSYFFTLRRVKELVDWSGKLDYRAIRPKHTIVIYIQWNSVSLSTTVRALNERTSSIELLRATPARSVNIPYTCYPTLVKAEHHSEHMV